MATLSSLRVEAFFAGHSEQGGSNKHWAAVLAEALDEQGTSLGWAYTNVFGAVGTSYRVGTHPTPLVTREEAKKAFEENVKRQTSARKGYREIAGSSTGVGGFNQFLSSFPFPLVMPDAAPRPERSEAPAISSPQASQSLPVTLHTIASITTLEQVMGVLACEDHGVNEKIDGERCIISIAGDGTLLAFNRSGSLVPPPPAAQALLRVGYPLIVDGERVTFKYAGQYAGLYVIFGLLAWKTEPVHEWSLDQKERLLEDILVTSGLIRVGGTTLKRALEGTLTPGLALLTMTKTREEARGVVEEVTTSKGEGLVIRARYAREGDARSVQKFKFYPTIDVFVIGIHRTGKVGSVKVGLVRPSDGAVIHLCNVRSGLRKQDVETIDCLLQQGTALVLELSFLLSSTTRLAPHQPSTSLSRRRMDKMPRDCTTEQLLDLLGSERAPLIEAAKAVKDLPFDV